MQFCTKHGVWICTSIAYSTLQVLEKGIFYMLYELKESLKRAKPVPEVMGDYCFKTLGQL